MENEDDGNDDDNKGAVDTVAVAAVAAAAAAAAAAADVSVNMEADDSSENCNIRLLSLLGEFPIGVLVNLLLFIFCPVGDNKGVDGVENKEQTGIKSLSPSPSPL